MTSPKAGGAGADAGFAEFRKVFELLFQVIEGCVLQTSEQVAVELAEISVVVEVEVVMADQFETSGSHLENLLNCWF